MFNSKRIVFLMVFLFVFAVTAFAENQTFYVDAKNNCRQDNTWLDTGIDVSSGDSLTITASGSGCHCSGCCYGPDGGGSNWSQYDGCYIAELTGKIGDGSQFCIGSSYKSTVSTRGRLYMVFNDWGCSNNSGGFDVTVEHTPTSTTSTSTILVLYIIA